MVVTCLNCNARFRIDTSRITLVKFKINCPRCKDAIVVENPPVVEVPLQMEPEEESAPTVATTPTPPSAVEDRDPPTAPQAETDAALSPEDLLRAAAEEAEAPAAPDEPDTGAEADAGGDAPSGGRSGEAAIEEPVDEVSESEATDAREKGRTDTFKKEFAGDYERLISLNYFELLGVDKNAEMDTIKTAYFRLAKKYHPDRYQTALDEETMKKLRDVSTRINLAYDELRNPDTRKMYTLKVTQPEKFEQQQRANRILEAMLQYEKGKVFFNKKNYAEALKCFEWAVELHSTEAEYHYWLCRSYQQPFLLPLDAQGRPPAPTPAQQQGAGGAPATGPAAARRPPGQPAPPPAGRPTRGPDFDCAGVEIEKALEIDPRVPKYHLEMGYLLKRKGQTKKAFKAFREAKYHDPKCHEAEREMSLIRQRLHAEIEEQKSPLAQLKSLFGGKDKSGTPKGGSRGQNRGPSGRR